MARRATPTCRSTGRSKRREPAPGPVPLVSVIAASNELPGDAEINALYDRFLLRFQVAPMSDDSFTALDRQQQQEWRQANILLVSDGEFQVPAALRQQGLASHQHQPRLARAEIVLFPTLLHKAQGQVKPERRVVRRHRQPHRAAAVRLHCP